MCGRFTLRAPASVVAEAFGLLEVPSLAPRYNIAPTQPAPVVRTPDQTDPASREFVWLRWGLIPSWASDPSIGNRMINARCESVAEKPAYRAPFRRRRCLIVADGFYEWQQVGRRKMPYFFHLRDDRPFAFAGLWESWEGPDHSVIQSCTLLTTTPNPTVAPIHDRMPAILPPEHYDLWLDPAVQRPDELQPLLVPWAGDDLAAYAVGTGVNRPDRDDPTCIEAAAR